MVTVQRQVTQAKRKSFRATRSIIDCPSVLSSSQSYVRQDYNLQMSVLSKKSRGVNMVSVADGADIHKSQSLMDSTSNNNYRHMINHDIASSTNKMSIFDRSTTKRFVNKQLQPFQKVYNQRKKRDLQCKYVFILLMLLNLVQWAWTLTLVYSQAFTMGLYNVFLIMLFNLVAFLIKICIFDRGYSRRNRMVKIPWLCNLTISDPYDLEPHKKKQK